MPSKKKTYKTKIRLKKNVIANLSGLKNFITHTLKYSKTNHKKCVVVVKIKALLNNKKKAAQFVIFKRKINQINLLKKKKKH